MPISSVAVENWGIVLYLFTYTSLIQKLNSLFNLFGSINITLKVNY